MHNNAIIYRIAAALGDRAEASGRVRAAEGDREAEGGRRRAAGRHRQARLRDHHHHGRHAGIILLPNWGQNCHFVRCCGFEVDDFSGQDRNLNEDLRG